MDLVSRTLTTEEAAACKKIYPRLARRLPADARVVVITGHYGYTTIRDRYGAESRMQHAIGPLPFHFLQCMESSLHENLENTAELVLLSNGTVIPVSFNDSWTVRQESAARDAFEKRNFAAAPQGKSKIFDRKEVPSVKEYTTYHPPLRITATIMLLAGSIMLLVWNHQLPSILLYAEAALNAASFLWILFPGSARAVQKTSQIKLSGTTVFRGSRIMVDRFMLQVLPKGLTVCEEGQEVMVKGWIHPKNHTTFYTTSIPDSYGDLLWSIEQNHWSRNWMRFLLPFIITAVTLLIYASATDSFSIAKDYLNWKEHGQTVRTFDSIEQLAGTLADVKDLPPGSQVCFDNFAIVENPTHTHGQYAYRLIEKRLTQQPDFSEARARSALLRQLIRTPLCTRIFIESNYPEERLLYISFYIDRFTSNESLADFIEAFPTSLHFASFLNAASAYEANPDNSNTDRLLRSWKAFIREETDAINELLTAELSRAVLGEPGISIISDYNTPASYYPLPVSYLKERHFNPYRIPHLTARSFGRAPHESWIAETPHYEEALKELEQLYSQFPYEPHANQTALVTGISLTPDGEPVVDLSFSLYRVERARQEAEKLMILLALAVLCALLAVAMSGYILWEVITKRRDEKKHSGLLQV